MPKHQNGKNEPLCRWPRVDTKFGAKAAVVAVIFLVALPFARAEPTAVAVDVSHLDVQGYDEIDAVNLEKKVVLRLVQEGFAVVSAQEHPRIRVEYFKDDILRIVVSADSTRRGSEVTISDTSNMDALHLEIAQKTIELVRRMPGLAPTPVVVPPVTKKQPESTIAATIVAKPSKASKPSLALEAMAGAVARGATDSYFGIGLAYPVVPQVAITGTLAVVPASTKDIDVFEWQAQIGGAWIMLHTQTWHLTTGVGLGVLTHHFSSNGEAGTRTDLLATAPVTLRYALSPSLFVGFRLAPGFAHKSREHTQGQNQLWQRSSARLEVLGHISYSM